MQLLPDIYLVGSGQNGFGISNPFDCHVYLLDGGNEAALIDSGAGVSIEPLLANIEQIMPLHKVRYIILTHGHADHSGSCAALRERLGCRILVGDGDADAVETGNSDASGMTIDSGGAPSASAFHLTAVPVARRLHDGDVVSVGRYTLQAISTPGHSRGSTSYLGEIGGKRVLFSGDTLQYVQVKHFLGWIAFLNSQATDINAYRASVRKLAGLKVDVLLPGHRMFLLSGGQRIIDDVIKSFSGMALPPSAIESDPQPFLGQPLNREARPERLGVY